MSAEEKEKSFPKPGLKHENLWIKIMSFNLYPVNVENMVSF